LLGKSCIIAYCKYERIKRKEKSLSTGNQLVSMKKKALQTLFPSSNRICWERLILTGYRATGKSRIGRLLADHFRCDLVDTDTLISEQAGMTISELIADQGWEVFRRLEQEVLAGLSVRTDVVIATGGGAILHEQAWQTLRKRSIVCWLTAEMTTIQERLARDERSADLRPPLSGMQPADEIRHQLALRQPLYRRGSDFAVSTDQKAPETIAGEILRQIEAAWPVDSEKRA